MHYRQIYKKLYINICFKKIVPHVVRRSSYENVLHYGLSMLVEFEVSITVSNLNFSQIERVTTHYQTLQTWIDHKATRYHNLNACYHMCYHTFFLSLALFWAIYNTLPRVTVKFIKKISNIVLKKLTATFQSDFTSLPTCFFEIYLILQGSSPNSASSSYVQV